MSETVSAAADTGAAPPPAATDGGDLEGLVKALGIEDDAPDASETSDYETGRAREDDGEERPEGIPAKDKLKVNGKEVERTYAEIKADAQKYMATELKLEQAKKQLDEAKGLQAKVGEQQQMIRNLLGVLQRGDLETISEFCSEYLNAGEAWNKGVINHALKLYEYSKMTPEQREAIENKRLITKMRAEREQQQKSDAERAYEYRVNQWSEHIATEIPKAIAEVGLADSPFIREHIVSAWRNAIERGLEPTAKAVAAFVKERLEQAGVKFQGAAPGPAPAAPAPRKRATPATVGMKSAQEPQGYQSFSEWQRTRGR